MPAPYARVPGPPAQTAPEMQTLLTQARQAYDTGKFDEAAKLYTQALSKVRALQDRHGEALALTGVAGTYQSMGQLQKALELYQQALRLFRALRDKRGEGDALNALAYISLRTGEPKKGLEFYQQVLEIRRAEGDKPAEVTSLLNIGNIYLNTGQTSNALKFYHEALGVSRESGTKTGEAAALIQIAYVHGGREPQKAREAYLQALTLQREIGDKQGEGKTLFFLGNVYKVTSAPQKALEFYQQALAIFRAVGNQNLEGDTLTSLGTLYSDLKEFPRALEFYSQALPVLRATGAKRAEAYVLYNFAYTSGHMGEHQKALEFYQQVLEINRSLNDKQEQVVALFQIALTERALKRLTDAEEHFEQAIALLEEFREKLGGFSEAKSAFLASKLSYYYTYLQSVLERGNSAKAFEIAQKTKARSLLDLMVSGRVDLNAGLTPEEQVQERELRQQADALNQQMVREGVENEVGAKKRFAALQEQLKETESKLQLFTDMLYARHPGLAHKRVAKTATLAGVTRTLPADTALLDYIVLSQNLLALFVVTRSGVRAVTLPVVYSDLAARCEELRSACADPGKDYERLARELYTLLLSAAEKELVGAKRLVICPDGALWDVPFQVLLQGDTFLAQRFEIVYAYSATGAQAALAARPSRTRPTRSLLAFANPDFGAAKRFGDLDSVPGQRPFDTPSRPFDTPSRPFDTPSRAFDMVSRGGRIAELPGTQAEADALKKLFPGATVLTGSTAQEARTRSEASKYRYLHFATHGFFNDASPLLSSLVLAQPEPGSQDDGFLTAREIFELDLAAELVVLSACNTARGVQRTGDGLIGLTWALFAAGCHAQVVSQWAVDDASTATLMTNFYSNLVKGKTGKGAALRQAALQLMRSNKYRHPYYWAPFVLIGDWR